MGEKIMIRMTSRQATPEEITTIKESYQSDLSEFAEELDNKCNSNEE